MNLLSPHTVLCCAVERLQNSHSPLNAELIVLLTHDFAISLRRSEVDGAVECEEADVEGDEAKDRSQGRVGAAVEQGLAEAHSSSLLVFKALKQKSHYVLSYTRQFDHSFRAHLDYVTQPCDIGHMTI